MSGCLGVCVSGCLRVCVSACLGVWVSGCLRVCVSGCLGVCVSAPGISVVHHDVIGAFIMTSFNKYNALSDEFENY